LLTVFTYSSSDVLYISRIPANRPAPPLREDECPPPDFQEIGIGRCRYTPGIDLCVPEPPDLDDLATLELVPDLIDHDARYTPLSDPDSGFEIMERLSLHDRGLPTGYRDWLPQARQVVITYPRWILTRAFDPGTR
jgi:hypothetical protein